MIKRTLIVLMVALAIVFVPYIFGEFSYFLSNKKDTLTLFSKWGVGLISMTLSIICLLLVELIIEGFKLLINYIKHG